MHVFRTEWLVTLPCKLAFFAAGGEKFANLVLTEGTSHVPDIVTWFPLVFNGEVKW